MTTRRRIDLKKVQEIQEFLQECREKEIPEIDRIFMEYKKFPDATRLEHALANYPLLATDKRMTIKWDILRKFNRDVRMFNKELKPLDAEIIATKYQFEDLFGKIFTLDFLEIAEGVKARKAADREDAYIKGHMEKKKRLIRMSKDVTLKKRQDAKMRAIQKVLDRRGKKE